MCNAKGLLGWFYPPSLLGWNSDKKANTQTLNAAKQDAQQIIHSQKEKNKLANSVQTTEVATQANQNTVKKLATQKVPLNTQNTGATIGSQSSVGLNLGGY